MAVKCYAALFALWSIYPSLRSSVPAASFYLHLCPILLSEQAHTVHMFY